MVSAASCVSGFWIEAAKPERKSTTLRQATHVHECIFLCAVAPACHRAVWDVALRFQFFSGAHIQKIISLWIFPLPKLPFFVKFVTPSHATPPHHRLGNNVFFSEPANSAVPFTLQPSYPCVTCSRCPDRLQLWLLTTCKLGSTWPRCRSFALFRVFRPGQRGPPPLLRHSPSTRTPTSHPEVFLGWGLPQVESFSRRFQGHRFAGRRGHTNH